MHTHILNTIRIWVPHIGPSRSRGTSRERARSTSRERLPSEERGLEQGGAVEFRVILVSRSFLIRPSEKGQFAFKVDQVFTFDQDTRDVFVLSAKEVIESAVKNKTNGTILAYG